MMKWIRDKHKDQKGITLVELLVVIPLIAIIGAGASAVTVRILKSQDLSCHTLATREVQLAGDWISQDFISSSCSGITIDNMTAASGFISTERDQYWTDTSGDYHTRTTQITYTLVSSGGMWDLERHMVSVTDGTTTDTTIVVAEHLDASQMSCSWDDEQQTSFTFVAAATVGSRTESREYGIQPRVAG